MIQQKAHHYEKESVLKSKEYKISSNEAIQFKLVSSEADLQNEVIVFNPIFTHQIFGEDEIVVGFRDLKIKYYVACDTLNAFISIEYSDKNEDVQCENILEILSKTTKHAFTTNIDTFTHKISYDTFNPFGALIKKYKLKYDNNNKEKIFEIYKATVCDKGFAEYYQRLQVFTLFFIDAGSFIDIKDEKWSYYLIYDVLNDKKYSIVGYLTVYNYYAYFDKIRSRISQVLILPPYQRNGHCTYLLQSVYNDLVPNQAVLDITVECPSNNFVKVRDFVDVKNALEMKLFSNDDFKVMSSTFFTEFKIKINQNLKLSKYQSRRVYEIICLKNCIDNVEGFKKYKLEIKNRLRKLNLPRKKLAKGCSDSNTNELLIDKEKMKKYLRMETNNLISSYRDVLDRFDYDDN